MSEVSHFLEEKIPHTVSEVICVKCCKRWIAIRPSHVLLKELECPNCGQGYVVETGQELKEDDVATKEGE